MMLEGLANWRGSIRLAQAAPEEPGPLARLETSMVVRRSPPVLDPARRRRLFPGTGRPAGAEPARGVDGRAAGQLSAQLDLGSRLRLRQAVARAPQPPGHPLGRDRLQPEP